MNAENETDKKDEKIYFGETILTCFACGEKFKESEQICPYCQTKRE